MGGGGCRTQNLMYFYRTGLWLSVVHVCGQPGKEGDQSRGLRDVNASGLGPSPPQVPVLTGIAAPRL